MKGLAWWQSAIFYQIYPRSFCDSNGDGIGDLKGIIQKLDYLKDLGVDALWLSPHYPSPLYDCGYDIADYSGVAPEYGSMDDFKRFLDEAHRRDLRVILDLVLNHTSDQHPWFLESRSSRENPRRDWYIWQDAKPDGSPPNNWYSVFGGPAWEWDELTGQYYYHFFFKQQPDLNWRNPQVKQAIFEVVRFWLDLGVDGYRLDAIGTLYEDPALPDQTCPVDQTELYRMSRMEIYPSGNDLSLKYWLEMFRYQHDLPETHDLMRELRAVIDEYDNRLLVGETEDLTYCGSGQDELHMVFNFPLLRLQSLTPVGVRKNQLERLAGLPQGGWPANTLGNHDASRVFSHFGDGQHDDDLARISLAVMLTLWGTPFLYNGEEIGMTDYLIKDLSQFKDILGIWSYHMEVDNLGASRGQALEHAARRGRDKCRTPMQWNSEPNGGFCPEGAQPWLPVNPNYAKGVNVSDQEGDEESLYNFYKHLLRLRRNTPALISGEFAPVQEDSENYLAFLRRASGQTCLVILNMSAEPATLTFNLPFQSAWVLFSSKPRESRIDLLSQMEIAPFEVYIAELNDKMDETGSTF